MFQRQPQKEFTRKTLRSTRFAALDLAELLFQSFDGGRALKRRLKLAILKLLASGVLFFQKDVCYFIGVVLRTIFGLRKMCLKQGSNVLGRYLLAFPFLIESELLLELTIRVQVLLAQAGNPWPMRLSARSNSSCVPLGAVVVFSHPFSRPCWETTDDPSVCFPSVTCLELSASV